MNKPLKRIGIAAAALTIAVAFSACSGKAVDSNDGGDDAEVLTGAGVSGTTITLGVMGDLTGPFAGLNSQQNRGSQLYWDEVNAAGGVCGTYTVELDIRDHGYNVQNAVSLYPQLAPNVVAFQNYVGGSHIMANLEALERDSRLTIVSAATPALAGSPAIMVPTPNYDTDIEILVQYLEEEGLVDEGATAAVIYTEGDYGETAAEGAIAAAETFGMTLLEYKIKASDADLTAQVGDALAKNASFFLLAGTPAHTAATASALEAQGLEMPIGGSWASYTPSLLETSAGGYLARNFYAGSAAVPFDQSRGEALLETSEADDADAQPTNMFTMGYGIGALMHAVLEKACAAGDLTPEGLVEARASIGAVDTDGVLTTLDYSNLGESPSRSLFMVQLDPDVPGQLRTISDGEYFLE